jgi:diguanylate cyclase (GGDEF)-like protein
MGTSYAWMVPGLLASGGLAARWTAMECRARRLAAEVSVLRHRARDAVVDLPTRAEWEAAACTRLSAAPRQTALVLIDLDEFKAINDTYGHQAGDRALREFAARLTRSFHGSQATMARLGGDEFGILAEADRTEKALSAMRRAIREPCCLGHGVTVRLRYSTGVAWCADLDTPTLSHALEVADQQLYRNKRAAKRAAATTLFD